MKKRIFVRLKVKTPARLNSLSEFQKIRPSMHFNIGTERSVFIYPCSKILSRDINYPIGFFFDLWVPGESVESGVSEALAICRILSQTLCSVGGLTSVADPMLISAYDSTSNVDRREGIFWIYLEDGLISGRLLHWEISETLFQGLSSYMSSLSVFGKRKKVKMAGAIRALEWLNMALYEKKAVNEFLILWIGLEALDGPLSGYMSSVDPTPTALQLCPKCKSEVSICPHCGETLPPQPITSSPLSRIKALFQEIFDDGDKLFIEIKDLRGSLFHSREILDANLIDKVEESVKHVRYALHIGLSRIFGLSNLLLDRVTKQTPRRSHLLPCIKYFGYVYGFVPPNLESPDTQPRVDIEKDKPRFYLVGDEINMDTSKKLTLRNCSFDIERYEIWGDEEAGIKISEKSFEEKDRGEN